MSKEPEAYANCNGRPCGNMPFILKLESDVNHLRAEAGRDSCADYVKRNAALVEALKEALGCTPHCDGPCKHHTHVAASVIQNALAAEEKGGA